MLPKHDFDNGSQTTQKGSVWSLIECNPNRGSNLKGKTQCLIGKNINKSNIMTKANITSYYQFLADQKVVARL